MSVYGISNLQPIVLDYGVRDNCSTLARVYKNLRLQAANLKHSVYGEKTVPNVFFVSSYNSTTLDLLYTVVF